jgi:dihydroneopterin aldolase
MKLSERVTAERLQIAGSDYLSIIAAGHAPRVVPQTGEAAEPAVGRAPSRVFVRRLQLAARIGVHDWEKLDLQPVVIDLEFAMATELACHTDRLEDAVDYAEVVATLKRLATAKHYELVEAMAETMARALKREFGVPWLLLRVTKLAPFPGAEVGVVVERGRWA